MIFTTASTTTTNVFTVSGVWKEFEPLKQRHRHSFVWLSSALRLSWWEISYLGDSGEGYRAERDFERNGWALYCVADYSPSELRLLREWAKEQGRNRAWVRRKTEVCYDDHPCVGDIEDYCATVAVVQDLKDDFNAFMRKFVRPILLFRKDPALPQEFLREIEHLNHRILTGSRGTAISLEFLPDAEMHRLNALLK